MKKMKQLIRQTIPTILMLMAFCATLHAQNGITVKGVVSDADGEPLIGATVAVKGNPSLVTVTDLDGNFTLTKVPSESSTLVFTYVGMNPYEVRVGTSVTSTLRLRKTPCSRK